MTNPTKMYIEPMKSITITDDNGNTCNMYTEPCSVDAAEAFGIYILEYDEDGAEKYVQQMITTTFVEAVEYIKVERKCSTVSILSA